MSDERMIVVGHDHFGKSLADYLSSDYIEFEKHSFPDTEVRPRLLSDIEDEHVVLVNRMRSPIDHRINPNSYFAETAFLLKKIRSYQRGGEPMAKCVDVVMPYFIYSRQHRFYRPGEPESARYVLEILKDLGMTRFFTVTAHSDRGMDSINVSPVPSCNIEGFESIGEYMKQLDLNDPVVLGADMSMDYSSRMVAELMGIKNDHSIEKRRDLDTGEIECNGQYDFNGRDLVIVDDMTTSGGTLIRAIEIGKKCGAGKTACAIVHPVLAPGAYEKISSMVDYLFATDTIDSPISKVSVAGKIAEKVRVLGKYHRE
jgi:ribose-phosphate pyrophosphokinase